MTLTESWCNIQRLSRIAWALMQCPTARLHFDSLIAPRKIRAVHAMFTRPHARFPLIKNKTMGIALIDLRKFNSAADYLATVKRKDFAGHQARQARKRGYSVRPINRNDYIDAIYRIHMSAEARQGRPMDQAYRIRQTHYDEGAPLRCYGVFRRDGTLAGYCSFGMYGNFAATDRLLGYKNNDGAMYLLLLEIVCALIQHSTVQYFMYDTFLGAQEGLQSFKRRIGFQPYRVSYTIQ